MEDEIEIDLTNLNVPTEFAHLPVYLWCDDQDEVEYVSIGPDGRLWHCVGNHQTLIESTQLHT